MRIGIFRFLASLLTVPLTCLFMVVLRSWREAEEALDILEKAE